MGAYAAPDLSVGFDASRAVEFNAPTVNTEIELKAKESVLTFFADSYPTPAPVKATRLLGTAQHVPTKPGEVVEVIATVDATLAVPLNVAVTETIAPPDLQVEVGVPSGEAQICQYGAPQIQGEVQGGVMYTTPEIQVQGGLSVASPEIQVQGGMQYAAPQIQVGMAGVSYTTPDITGQIQYAAPETQFSLQAEVGVGQPQYVAPETQYAIPADISYSIAPGVDGQVQGMYAAPTVEGQMSYNITPDVQYPMTATVQSGYGVQVEQPQFATAGLQYGAQGGGATYMSPGMDGQVQYEYQVQPGLPQPQVQYDYQVQPGLPQPTPAGGNMMYTTPGVD